jgi:hypothetical protein
MLLLMMMRTQRGLRSRLAEGELLLWRVLMRMLLLLLLLIE